MSKVWTAASSQRRLGVESRANHITSTQKCKATGSNTLELPSQSQQAVSAAVDVTFLTWLLDDASWIIVLEPGRLTMLLAVRSQRVMTGKWQLARSWNHCRTMSVFFRRYVTLISARREGLNVNFERCLD